MKKYAVKVYSKSGNFLTDWNNEIINDIDFNKEINTAGSELKIKLARNAGDYGEGSDVDFGLIIKIFVYDKELTGIDDNLLFQGRITSYTPIYKDNVVEVTVLSMGEDLNNYLVLSPRSLDISATTLKDTMSIGQYGGYYWYIYQYFVVTTSTYYNEIELYLWNTQANQNIEVNAYIYYEYNDSLVVRATATSSSDTPGYLRFSFKDSVFLNAGAVYYVVIYPKASYSYNCLKVYLADENSDIFMGQLQYALLNAVVAMKVYTTSGETRVPCLSMNPKDIVAQVMDSYTSQGGNIVYESDYIDDPGTTVSYTFNTNTILECIQKIIELYPENYYWFIDNNNILNIKLKSNEPDHYLALEKDIIDAKFEKKIDSIINVVYFSGGDTGGGENFFKKYSDENSIDAYGQKILKYSDQRVTVENTADTIANSILSTKSQPELNVEIEILDSNNNQNLGYDIESIQVGDVVAVRNITQQVGLSSWDYGRWDESYWDYNIYNLSSLELQIQSVKYTPNKLTITASTMAVDVNKRIEDINRNLEVLQNNNNPDGPG